MKRRKRLRHHDEPEAMLTPHQQADTTQTETGADHTNQLTSHHSNILQMQRTQGNAYVQRMLGDVQRSKKKPKMPKIDEGAEEERINQLVIDGVLAFEELGSFTPPIGDFQTEPSIPGIAPTGMRPALEHLLNAKKYRYGLGMKTEHEVVQERLAPEGPLGFGKMLIFGQKLILHEKLDRQMTAKTEWQKARPVIAALVNRYQGLNGANAEYASQLQSLLYRLDDQITRMIPLLHLEMAASMTPQEVQRVKTLAEAKQAVGAMDELITGVSIFNEVKDAKGKADEFMGEDSGPMGESIHAATPTSAVNTKKFNDDIIEFNAGVSVADAPAPTKFQRGLAAYDKLKTLVDLYNSPEGVAESLGAIAKAENGAMGLLETEKAVMDISTALLGQVKDTGKLLIEGAAELYDWRVARIAKAHPNDIAILANATSLTQRANALREFAAKLEGLGKLTGVIEIVSGSLGLIQGIGNNDFEAAMGGAIGVTEGVLSAAAPAVGIGLMPWMLSAKGMVHVVAQTSRMLQAIRNADMKRAIGSVEEDLNAAALNTKLYEVAMNEWYMRYASPDPVEQALGETYMEKAKEKLVKVHLSLASTMSSVVQGPLSHYPVLVDTFDMAFGGHAMVMLTYLSLKDGVDIQNPGDMMIQAENLEEIVKDLGQAVGDMDITMKALEGEQGGKVKFAESQNNTLTFKNKLVLTGGSFGIQQGSDGIDLDGPIDNQGYKDWLAAKFHGKSLSQINGIVLKLETDVMGETITMRGSDGELSQHDSLSDKALAAVAQAVLNKDPSEVSSAEVVRALWRFCLRNVKMPDGKYFK